MESPKKREYSFFRRSPESTPAVGSAVSKPEYHFFRPEGAKERSKNTAGLLGGSTFAAMGAGAAGGAVFIGKTLEQMMRTDFDANGIHFKNTDASRSFSTAYNWASGKKKAA
jgi:hypothetical protein